jgi:hypothetical protein
MHFQGRPPTVRPRSVDKLPDRETQQSFTIKCTHRNDENTLKPNHRVQIPNSKAGIGGSPKGNPKLELMDIYPTVVVTYEMNEKAAANGFEAVISQAQVCDAIRDELATRGSDACVTTAGAQIVGTSVTATFHSGDKMTDVNVFVENIVPDDIRPQRTENPQDAEDEMDNEEVQMGGFWAAVKPDEETDAEAETFAWKHVGTRNIPARQGNTDNLSGEELDKRDVTIAAAHARTGVMGMFKSVMKGTTDGAASDFFMPHTLASDMFKKPAGYVACKYCFKGTESLGVALWINASRFKRCEKVVDDLTSVRLAEAEMALAQTYEFINNSHADPTTNAPAMGEFTCEERAGVLIVSHDGTHVLTTKETRFAHEPVELYLAEVPPTLGETPSFLKLVVPAPPDQAMLRVLHSAYHAREAAVDVARDSAVLMMTPCAYTAYTTGTREMLKFHQETSFKGFIHICVRMHLRVLRAKCDPAPV